MSFWAGWLALVAWLVVTLAGAHALRAAMVADDRMDGVETILFFAIAMFGSYLLLLAFLLLFHALAGTFVEKER